MCIRDSFTVSDCSFAEIWYDHTENLSMVFMDYITARYGLAKICQYSTTTISNTFFLTITYNTAYTKQKQENKF